MRWMIWALALFGLVMAAGAGASEDAMQGMLQARYAQMECRAAFMYTVMENAEGFDPDADLGPERAQIQEQMRLMEQYADGGDYSSFNQEMSQLRNAFTNGMQGARNAHGNALNAMQGDGSGQGGQNGAQGNGSQEMSQLRERMLLRHQEAQGEYASCMSNATRGRVQAELAEFTEWHGNGQQTAEQMRERGYNVSGLEEILDEAEDVSGQLEEDVEDADDYVQMGELRREAWKQEFYLWAEFHVERFNLILDRIDGRTGGQYSSELGEIRGFISTALEIGEDDEYDAEEAAEAKEILNDGARQIRALLQEMG